MSDTVNQQSAMIQALWDRLTRIHTVCRSSLPRPEKLRQIETLSGGFGRGPALHPNDGLRWVCLRCATVNGIEQPICVTVGCQEARPMEPKPGACGEPLYAGHRCSRPKGHQGHHEWSESFI